MAITYPLNTPSNRYAQVVLRATAVTSQSESPFTLEEQIQVFPGQRWSGMFRLPPMKREEADEWFAFFLSLNGRQGWFLMGDPSAVTPKGPMSGAPVVKGAGQSGNELLLEGCTPNVTGWGKKGDYIQLTVGGKYRLHALLEDADTDSNGETTLLIWPRLREAPDDQLLVVTTNCKGQFRLAQSFSEKTIDVGNIYSQAFPVVEVM